MEREHSGPIVAMSEADLDDTNEGDHDDAEDTDHLARLADPQWLARVTQLDRKRYGED